MNDDSRAAPARLPIIGGWLIFLLVAVLSAWRAPFSTDLSAFLPRTPTAAQAVLVDQLRDGAVSRLILIGIHGGGPEALAAASRALATALAQDPRFTHVGNGEQIRLEADQRTVFAHRYALSPGVVAERFSTEGLRAALHESMDLLDSPAGFGVAGLVAADPTGETLRVGEALTPKRTPARVEGVWGSAAGDRVVLLAQTRAAGFDIDGQAAAIDAIRTAFEPLRGGTDLAVELTGPGVFAVDTRDTIRGDATRFSMLATGAIAILLLSLLRSPRLALLGLVPVATGAAAGLAAVALVFGEVHGITVGFGATLIGEAVDYGLYLLLRADGEGGPRRAFRMLWPTLRLGMLTSVFGYAALLLSDFPGLSQLGLFSIAGLVTALLTTRFVLPALLPTVVTLRGVEALARHAGRLVARARRLRIVPWLALAAGTGTLIVIGLRHDLPWNDELAALSPIPAADLRRDERLRDLLGAPDVRHVVVVRGASREAVLRGAESAAVVLDAATQSGALDHYDSPARLLPSERLQAERRAALPDEPTLRHRLAEAARGLPFRPNVFEPFIAAVQSARQASPLDTATWSGTTLALQLDSLLAPRDGGWQALLPLSGLHDADAVAHDIAALGDPDVLMLDIKAESDRLYAGYRREALGAAAWGVAAVLLLLIVVLRTPRRVLRVCVPLAAAVICTIAGLLLAGQALTLFHLIGLLLSVAVGSNYTLFFDRTLAADPAADRTALSLLAANGSTVLGFGLLGLSHVPVLSAIGTTVAVGAALSLLFAAALSRAR
ncbi:MAG: MMPL family transporter [Burkholderiales bacterium]|nr:MMPL family transporter [Burkholderiales bacterium]